MIRAVAALLFWLIVALPAAAQTASADTSRQVERWELAVATGEAQVAAPDVSSGFLEQLRATMIEQRSAVLAVRDQAQDRVAPLRAQLDAIGVAPPEGAVEAPEIVEQRRRLSEQIAAAEVPVKEAEAVFRRTDALIQKIDGVLRTRFRDELLLQQGSPLGPGIWLPAIAEIIDRAITVIGDAAEGLSQAGARIWVALAAGVLGLVLLVGVRVRVMGWLGRRVAPALRDDGRGQREVWASGGLTLAALVIPGVGAALLLYAIRISGMGNGAAAPYLRDAGWFALAMVVGYWLAQTMFGDDVPARDLMPMSPRQARRARRATLVLGLVVGLDLVLVRGQGARDLSIAALSVLNLVLVMLGGLTLRRFGAAIAADAPAARDPDGDTDEQAEPEALASLARTIRRLSVRASRLLGLVAPLLAAFGFYAASRYVFYPALLSGAVFAAYIVILALVADWARTAAAARSGEQGETGEAAAAAKGLGLLPLATGFLLAGVAIPVLALIWGARESEIGDVWRMVTEGVAFGGARIQPFDFLIFVVILVIGYALTRLVQSLLRGTILPQTSLDAGGRMAVVSLVGYVGILIALVASIQSIGVDLSNLAFIAGALTVGIGFGLQNVVSNFVSGLILLVERPVKEGDWIRVGEFEGYVKRISVRATQVQTFDRAVVVVPNADLITRPVLNRTLTSTIGRVTVPVGVAHGSDTRRVETVLREVAASCDLLLRRPAPTVAFRGFGPTSLDFEIVGFLRDVNNMLLATNFLNHALAERLRSEGIEIPAAQSEQRLRSLEEAVALMRLGQAQGEGRKTS